MTSQFYPNQQLASVSLECYFKGRVAYRASAQNLQDDLGDEFPNLFVPNVSQGSALDLQPYQLRSSSHEEIVAFAANQLSYVNTDYPGCDGFIARATNLLGSGLSHFGVSDLERVTYRYNNVVAIGRDENGFLPVAEVLNLPAGSWCDPTKLTELDLKWQQQAESAKLVVQVGTSESTGLETLEFSIGAVVAPGGQASEIASTAKLAHDVARGWFEANISAEFREFLEGES